MRIVKPSVRLLWITPEAEKQIESAGRTCYKSEDKITTESAKKFIINIRERGHHPILEHASASFRIVTDRGVSHEIVRHRLASYAMESTRYANYSKDRFDNECGFIQPPDLTEEKYSCWKDACLNAEKNYLFLIASGCTPQIARSVLPICLKTEIVMAANFREWRHFIKLRKAPTAHPQIRPIAISILNILTQHAPNVFSDLIREKE